jgi:hypothetical protein
MITQDQRKQAARKAVQTLRMNLLAKVSADEVAELANSIIAKQYEIDEDFTRSAIIAREVGKTTWKSFCRFGDRNGATKGMILSWICNDGAPLDVQALFISAEYGLDLLPDELAEFIANHDRGKGLFEPYAELEALKKTFRYLTGFHWNLKFARANITNAKIALTDGDEYPF